MNEIRKMVVPQQYLDLVNQVFEIEKKVESLKEENSLHRNINKLKGMMENQLFNDGRNNMGFSYHNPIGERYDETRTDCEASISGSSADNLFVVEVIKPIVFYSYFDGGHIRKAIVQKAVVVVESKS